MVGFSGAPEVVEAMPRVGLPYSLFSVLTLRESRDGRWTGGIEWEALTCDPVTGLDQFDDPDCQTEFEKVFSDLNVIGEARPFSVYGSAKCGVPGGRVDLKAEEQAVANLLVREEVQAEQALWRRLATAATDLNPAGALDPPSALAALEKWLGSVYGSLGAIHGDRGAISMLSKRVSASGTRLLTKVGTPVVAGGGYPGTSPAGAAAADGETWVFASPALFGYRGQVFPRSALDQRNNDFYSIAERDYVIGFDPCGVAAVRMLVGNTADE